MSNILAFPARASTYRQPVAHWRTFKVHGINSHGDRVILTYRALSADSAHCRARYDGLPHVTKIERVDGAPIT